MPRNGARCLSAALLTDLDVQARLVPTNVHFRSRLAPCKKSFCCLAYFLASWTEGQSKKNEGQMSYLGMSVSSIRAQDTHTHRCIYRLALEPSLSTSVRDYVVCLCQGCWRLKLLLLLLFHPCLLLPPRFYLLHLMAPICPLAEWRRRPRAFCSSSRHRTLKWAASLPCGLFWLLLFLVFFQKGLS